MSERTIGHVVDGLGVIPKLADTDLVSSAVVLMAVVDEDGDERLSIAWSPGLSWLTRTGMLHHALAEETKEDEA